MRLCSQGTPEEQLLLLLLGIRSGPGEFDDALLLGCDAQLPAGWEGRLYLRLPDPEHPRQETERLAKLLGRAIGMGEVRL